jgi:hypothetical protein
MQYKRQSPNISSDNTECACYCPNLYENVYTRHHKKQWKTQWSITYSELRLSLIWYDVCWMGTRICGLAYILRRIRSKIPFTIVLAKKSLRLLRTGQIKPNGINCSGTSFLEILMHAQLLAALIFGIFFLLRKLQYLRRSVAVFDH